MNPRVAVIIGIMILGVAILFTGVSRKGKSTTAGVSSSSSAAELYNTAVALKGDNELVQAKETYQKIISSYPNYEGIEKVQKDLEDINIRVIFTNVDSPNTVLHEVQIGDTIGKLAKKYNTTAELIRLKNNIKNDMIRVGQQLRIWTAPFVILVDKSQNILILKTGDQVVKVYTVSTGVNNSTPVGTFTVVNKLLDPVWFKSGAIIPPASPQNVLGSRWLGFDIPGYGIHGTIEPQTIGRQETAGCVRMVNHDVEELYSIVPAGTKVTITD